MQKAIMTGDRGNRFSPGDTAYVRFMGDSEFEIVKRASCSSIFPHWVCKTWGGKKYDYFIIPQIHLSSKKIEALVQFHNRKQLSFFN
jgi:hypothetical protein